jgi:hypothetical protein
MTDDTLRARIRRKFSAGDLPTKPPLKTWGGYSTGETCSVCDVKITAVSEIEVDSADGRGRFYHVRCYQLLMEQRQSLWEAGAVS